ncbi:mannosyltransferase, partial [Spiromyces aspiralis]
QQLETPSKYIFKDSSLLFTPSWTLTFRIISLIRIMGAFTAPIQDCDEVYNYWEPVHLIHFGYGKQTWEYGPQFALRSWAFSWIYALIGYVSHFFFALRFKHQLFMVMRLMMGLACSACEATYITAIANRVDRRIANYTLVILATSAGMFHAAVSILPSSFAMYFIMLGSVFTMQSPSLVRAHRMIWALVLFGIGAVWGWPYAMIVIVPSVIEELFTRGSDRIPDEASPKDLYPILKGWRTRRIKALCLGLAGIALISAPLVAIDSYYYGRLVVAPWNAVKYNLFGGEGRSPSLYGAEPWWFYFANGIINFNIMFVFALMSLPLWGYQYTLWRLLDKISTHHSRRRKAKMALENEVLPVHREPTHPHMLLLVRLIPFYLVLTVFSLQPHKEERFLYIVYPLVAFNAATSLYLIRNLLNEMAIIMGTTKALGTAMSVSAKLNWLILTVTALVSGLRMFAMFQHHTSPASIYQLLPAFQDVPEAPLGFAATAHSLLHLGSANVTAHDNDDHNISPKPVNVCVGKDWHWFPSHYHLPNNHYLRFLPSGFMGQLPADFVPVSDKYDTGARTLCDSTSREVEDINDLNREVPARYWKESDCQYIVDIDWTSRSDDEFPRRELPYGRRSFEWEAVKCLPVLDRDRSKMLSRTLYIPETVQWLIDIAGPVFMKGWGAGRNVEFKPWNKWGTVCIFRPKAAGSSPASQPAS